MNRKAFTLIELLVVVAIIGILAAVGVVAYTGYIKHARAAVIKAQHAQVVKYVSSETTKCEWEQTVMDGNLTCSGRTITSIMKGATNAFPNMKNPIDPSLPAIQIGGSYDSGSNNIGVVIMHKISLKQIRFGICYQYKCYENSAETNWKDEYRFFEEYVDFL